MSEKYGIDRHHLGLRHALSPAEAQSRSWSISLDGERFISRRGAEAQRNNETEIGAIIVETLRLGVFAGEYVPYRWTENGLSPAEAQSRRGNGKTKSEPLRL